MYITISLLFIVEGHGTSWVCLGLFSIHAFNDI